MTEKEATDKWCPLAKKDCIASRCMAWRWIQDELVAFAAGSRTVVSEGKHGYCGLAGTL